MEDDLDYDILDPGIREVVRWLRSLGVPTCDSGDGVSKPEDERFMEVPHVFAQYDTYEDAYTMLMFLHNVLSPYDPSGEGDQMLQIDYRPGGPWILNVIGFGNDDIRDEVFA